MSHYRLLLTPQRQKASSQSQFQAASSGVTPPRGRPRTGVALLGLISLFGLFCGCEYSEEPVPLSSELDGEEALTLADIRMKPGEFASTLPFPGLTAAQEAKARRELALHDQRVAQALSQADQASRSAARSDQTARPVRPFLPGLPVESQALPDTSVPRMVLPASFDQTENGPLPPGEGEDLERALTARDPSAAAACSGNCYQTDRAFLTDHPNDVYAMDYYVWLAVPQTNESNQCDSSSSSSICFWFYAMQMSTTQSGSAIHIGPQRGSSLAGVAGANWRMNMDGYNNGVHVGGQSTKNLPVATWIRVRTWRLSTGSSGGIPNATFGIYAMWNNVDNYLGSVKINGTTLTTSFIFMEVYEANGQCSTDLERGYFDNPAYQRNGAWYRFAHATANYEANCSNTSWLVQGAPDFIRDERETTRVIAQGASIW